VTLSITEQVDLQPYNSFGIAERARQLVLVHSERALHCALTLAAAREWPVTLLGGGSNVVLTGELPGLVVVMRNRGRRVLSRESETVVIEAEAGENWHALVNWTLDLGLSGLENLSLIPGTVGASPVQNIGAYGVELQDVFESLDAFDRQTGQTHQFTLQDCCFAYRDSLFKQRPGRYVILRVRLRLSRRQQLKIDYGPLKAAWLATGLTHASARVVSELVCTIRRSKLPDPAKLGNAGSFFKNPLVTAAQAEQLTRTWPQLPCYPQSNGGAKLAAGWLIDQAGWKGHRQGAVGVHSEQALVLVNFGGARGDEVMTLARRIQADIRQRFGIELEMEPQLIGG